MPTAEGFIKATSSGTKLVTTFIIDDIEYSYAGSVNSSLQGFVSSHATLTYSSLGQLTTTRDYEGKVGTSTVRLALANGPIIEGPLDIPIAPASTVSGNAVWTQN